MQHEVGGFELAFKPHGKYDTEVFLYFFIGEVLQARTDPTKVLERLIVEEVCQNKIEEPDVEHELLLVNTLDTEDGTKREFILERMVARNNTTRQVNIDTTDRVTIPFTTKIYDIFKKLLNFFESKSDSALSMEEGRSYSPSPSVASEPFSIDSVTVSASESADAVSDAVADSLNRRSPAMDRFLGQDFARSPKYRGTNIRRFKPDRLFFFEFVVLAHVVHKRYPFYTRMRDNCMFFASVIYEAAERYGGNADNGDNNTHLLGRWKGVKVTKVDAQEVADTVTKLKLVLGQQIHMVSSFVFKLSH